MSDKIIYKRLDQLTLHQCRDEITRLESELTDLKAKYQKVKRTIDFYATYSPFQFPEGYYEICIEKGVGGYNRFGTLARKTLAELGEKE